MQRQGGGWKLRCLRGAVAVLVACKSPAAADRDKPGTTAALIAEPASRGGALVEGATARRPHHEESVVECPAGLPAHGAARISALLIEANRQIARGQYAAAWTCADRAGDLDPTSVQAQHLRAAALTALGREQEAQIAYGLALALDPDDLETLRAAADFYINGGRSRDALRLGLALAQRGSHRAEACCQGNLPLVADLAVLEAQALNDLGHSPEALARVGQALRVAPGRGAALHEEGVALFDLSRFVEARSVLLQALTVQPADAYTHQLLGRTLEHLGDMAGAAIEEARALELAPSELSRPVLVPVAEFQQEIDAVIGGLPAARRARIRKIKIEIADLPDPADLAAGTPPFPPTILGLYRGPVGHAGRVSRQEVDGPVSIVLYRKNLAWAVKSRAELSEQIRDTLLHEIGHLEGLDEDDLRRRGME